jgi:putative DNA primase/helicase
MSRKPEHAREGAFTFDKHAEALAAVFIRGLQEGTSPWVKPWTDSADAPGCAWNPSTGKAYRGGNALALMCAEADMQMAGKMTAPDSRWMTYRQAAGVGAQVQKGQKGVQCLKWLEVDEKRGAKEERPVADGPEDAKGKRMVAVPFWVFHASQMDGLPPAPKHELKPEVDRFEQVEALVAQSGAVVQHGGNRAYYSPSLDVIQLPNADQFKDAMGYASTKLHELAHWSGHDSRLARAYSFDRHAEAYAREELRAEMASLSMQQRLDVPHQVGQHVAYVGSWIKLLKDDPRELLRAASDVEKILTFLKVPEREYEILPQIERQQEQTKQAERPNARQSIAAIQAVLDHPETVQQPARERARSRGIELGL